MGPALPPLTTNTSPYVPLSPTSIRFYYVIRYHTLPQYNQEVLVQIERHCGYDMTILCSGQEHRQIQTFLAKSKGISCHP